MSIVSARIDTTSIPRRKRGPVKAVCRDVPGSDIEFALPPQKPFQNISLKIRKPSMDVAPRPNGVPLKMLQEGSDYNNIYAGPILKVDKLAPKIIRSSFDFNSIPEMMDAQVRFDVPFDYKAGIRPSVRALKPSDIGEPTAPMFRP